MIEHGTIGAPARIAAETKPPRPKRATRQFPLLAPTSTAVVLLLLINAFQAFDEFYNTLATVTGYPNFGRPPLVYLYLISLGGGSQDLGLGSAGTLILTVVILAFGLVQNRLLSIGSDS